VRPWSSGSSQAIFAIIVHSDLKLGMRALGIAPMSPLTSEGIFFGAHSVAASVLHDEQSYLPCQDRNSLFPPFILFGRRKLSDQVTAVPLY
jgi:hypothetical protein